MKKTGLKEMKRRNREMLIRTILEKGELSRIELAHETQLSPSTVSALVGELLEEGILAESGQRAITAGRSRTALDINTEYGCIAVVNIGRKGASLDLFDMCLNRCNGKVLSESYLSGNELLVAITAAVFELFDSASLHAGKVAGFGLLFQEDMKASEFNVMYSTGFSSASISLREALITQFRVPVTEEYSQVYTVSRALEQRENVEAENTAHIAIGERVLASITLSGRPLPLREGMCSDVTPMLCGDALVLPALKAAAGPDAEETGLLPARQGGWAGILSAQISGLIAVLCTLFPLDTVLLSGHAAKVRGFVEQVDAQVKQRLSEQAPEVRRADLPHQDLSALLAERIRKNVLCAD